MAPKAKRKGVSFVSPGKNAEDPPLALTGLTQLPTPALLEAIRGAAVDSGAPGLAQFSASQDVGPTQIEPSTLLPSLDVAVTDDDDETDVDEVRGSALKLRAALTTRSTMRASRVVVMIHSEGGAAEDDAVAATPLEADAEVVQPTPAATTPVAAAPPRAHFPAASSFARSGSPSPCAFGEFRAPPPVPPEQRTHTVLDHPRSAEAPAPAAVPDVPAAAVPVAQRKTARSEPEPESPLDSVTPHVRRLRTEIPDVMVGVYQEMVRAGVPVHLRRTMAALAFYAEATCPLTPL
jgi:hypothetical protein